MVHVVLKYSLHPLRLLSEGGVRRRLHDEVSYEYSDFSVRFH